MYGTCLRQCIWWKNELSGKKIHGTFWEYALEKSLTSNGIEKSTSSFLFFDIDRVVAIMSVSCRWKLWFIAITMSGNTITSITEYNEALILPSFRYHYIYFLGKIKKKWSNSQQIKKKQIRHFAFLCCKTATLYFNLHIPVIPPLRLSSSVVDLSCWCRFFRHLRV